MTNLDAFVHQPHDKLFRWVFSDPAAAAGFLRAYLPRSVSGALQWSTVALQNTSFIDDELRNSESDLLFAIRRRSGRPAWLYVLLEHQSKPSRWMRLRLLKYCSRIWERDRTRYRKERVLRPIVPLVFYQGRQPWASSTEFSDLFAAAVRGWPWLPHFEHLLIDLSAAAPETVEAVRGELKGRVALLTMMAAYRDHWQLLQRVMPLLTRLNRRGGMDELRPFILYVLATQRATIRARFIKELRRQVPGPGGDAMNYIEQLFHKGVHQGRQEGHKEGELKGRLQGQVATIEELVRAGFSWSAIQSATGVDEDGLRALQQRLAEWNDGPATTTEAHT